MFFQGSDGLSSCKKCSQGRFSAEDHLAAPDLPDLPCDACPSGTWSDISGAISSTVCASCNVGRYGVEVGALSKSACKMCAIGRFSARARASSPASCVACPTGYSQYSVGEGSCIPCRPGNTAGEEGMEYCKQCALGKFASDTKSSSLECEVAATGRFASSTTRASHSAVPDGFRAINCSILDGTINAAGCTRIEVCSSGTYGTTPPSGKCKLCPKGYASSPGLQSCHVCDAGTFGGSQGQIECTLCPLGYFSRSQGVHQCKQCVQGTDSAAGSTNCATCAAGKFSTDGTQCVDCPSGYYQGLTNSVSCTECALRYSTNQLTGAKVCTPVPEDPNVDPPTIERLRPTEYSYGKKDEAATVDGGGGNGLDHMKDDNNGDDERRLTTDKSQGTTGKMQASVRLSKQDICLCQKESVFIEYSSKNNLHQSVAKKEKYDGYKKMQVQFQSKDIKRQCQEWGYKACATTTRQEENEDGEGTSGRMLVESEDEDLVVVNITLDAISNEGDNVWESRVFLRSTFVLDTGGTGRMSPVNPGAPVMGDCRDSAGSTWYLRTHPHDNTCEKPIDLLSSEDDVIQCHQCPAGGSCHNPSGSGMLLWDIATSAGFWRVPWAPMVGDLRNDTGHVVSAPQFFAPCPHPEACLGVGPSDFFNASGWFDGENGTYLEYENEARNWKCPDPHPTPRCLEGTEGPLCATCADGYTRVRGECAKCVEVGARMTYAIFGIGSVLVCMVLAKRCAPKMNSKVSNAAWDAMRILIILLNLAQIACSLPYHIQVPWPPTVVEFLEIFDVSGIDLAAITGATCDNRVNFEVRFAIMAMSPIFVLLFGAAGYYYSSMMLKQQMETLQHDYTEQDAFLMYDGMKQDTAMFKKKRKQALEDTYLDLFRVIDVDNSQHIDTKELVELLKLVGFTENIEESVAKRLINKITGSVNVTELNMGAFIHEMKNGGIADKLKNILELESSTSGGEEGSTSGEEGGTSGEEGGKSEEGTTERRTQSRLKSSKTILDQKDDASSTDLIFWNYRRKLISMACSGTMSMLLFLHTPVTRKVFEFFDCRAIGTGDYTKSFLRVDYSYQCQDSSFHRSKDTDIYYWGKREQHLSYSSFMAFVIFVLLFFSIALPLSLSTFLILHRKNLYTPNTLLSVGWLYSRLNRGCEYWPIHELARKTLLTSVIVFFPRDPAVRACMAMIICIMAQCSLNYHKPHRNRLVFWVEQGSFTVTLSLYVCAVAFQAQMSTAASDQLVWSLITVVTLFFVGGLCSIALSFCMVRKHLGNVEHLKAGERAQLKHRASLRAKDGLDFGSSIDKLKVLEQHASASSVEKKFEEQQLKKEKVLEEKKLKSNDRLSKRLEARKKKVKKGRKKKQKSKLKPKSVKSTNTEEEQAAVKIQSIARGKRDRQRVKDKKMTYEKFAAKVAQRLGTMDPEKIFAKVDKTNDGTIDSKEFSSLVRSIAKGETYTKELLRAAWLAAVGGDATKVEISAEELQVWIKACQDPEEVRAAVKIQSIARGKRDRQRVKDKKMTYEKFAAKVAQRLGTMDPEKIFAKVDKTNDGTIDSKEFSSLVRSIAKGETYTKELLRAAWLAAVGGDATKMEISAEELQAWIKACQNPDT